VRRAIEQPYFGKVVVEAPQKTPLLFARDFGSSFDHFENSPIALKRLIA
jgi:hypothetical protein